MKDQHANPPGDALTVAQARRLAEREKEGWCILPFDYDLVVGKLDEDLRIIKVCRDGGDVLRFPSIPSAREFLRDTLLVSRSMLFPVPPEL